MAIQCEHTISVTTTPAQVFALLDNLPRTPEWLKPCTELRKLAPGPNAVGDRLSYSFSQGGRPGLMQGEILERVPGSRLVCVYSDAMMEVRVEFNVLREPSGARLTHRIAITPRTWLARLMSPLIRRSLPKQTRDAMERIRAILESPNS